MNKGFHKILPEIYLAYPTEDARSFLSKNYGINISESKSTHP